MYGFSSRKRDPIRFHQLKTIDESYNAGVCGRISEIKPGYYTRMGTAIRHASGPLAGQPAGRRIPAAPVWQRRLCGHSPPLAVTPGIAVAIRPFDCLVIAIKNAGSSGGRSSGSELTQIN
jgi:hypothetical protein